MHKHVTLWVRFVMALCVLLVLWCVAHLSRGDNELKWILDPKQSTESSGIDSCAKCRAQPIGWPDAGLTNEEVEAYRTVEASKSRRLKQLLQDGARCAVIRQHQAHQ